MPGDTLIGAVRRAIGGGDWHAASSVADLLAGTVPDDLALKTYERLARAGGKAADTDAGKLALGAARVVKEKLQRLVTDGLAEAVGDGDTRTYRMKGTHDMADRPKPALEYVALERLTFDHRLQMRDIADADGNRLLFVESWVEHLVAALEGGAELPPIEAVREKNRFWVFAGFNRGEARRRRGENSVAVLVYPGTFVDALRWAVPANAAHGLNRKPDDCRRAFDSLFENEQLRAEVLAAAKVKGVGIYRAFARAAGLSGSIIQKYLTAHGYRATRTEGLEKIESPPPPPARAKPAPAPDPADKSWRERTPEEAGLADELPGKTVRALDLAAVETCGELADRLLKGETFGLFPGAVAELQRQVEAMSADDAEPVRFGPADPYTPPAPEKPRAQAEAESAAEVEAADAADADRPAPSHIPTSHLTGHADTDAAVELVNEAQAALRKLMRVAGQMLDYTGGNWRGAMYAHDRPQTTERLTFDISAALRAAAEHHLVPVEERRSETPRVVETRAGGLYRSTTTLPEYWWPVLAALTAVFADVASRAFQPAGEDRA